MALCNKILLASVRLSLCAGTIWKAYSMLKHMEVSLRLETIADLGEAKSLKLT